MAIEQFNNLYRLRIMGFVNVYFVREEDGLTVVDTGLGMNAGKILKTAGEIGGAIKRIVITHDHMDHIGGLDKLHKLVPHAEVIVAERTVPFMQGDMRLKPDEPIDKLRGGYVKVKTTPTRTVKEGDQIGSLQVVAAPGHTPDQIALLDRRDNSLIAADAFVTLFGTVVSGQFNFRFPFPTLATWHKPTCLATAHKLRTLNPSLLAVGHGKVLTNPLAEMDEAIRAAEKSFGVN